MDIVTSLVNQVVNHPSETIVKSVLGVIALPFVATLFDRVTQIISDLMVTININIVDKVPIRFIRKKIQDTQINMLKNSIAKYQNAIERIKKDRAK
jgi:hypothetical protein